MTIPSYGKPLNLGHKDLENLFDGPVLIQEKIDGSQLSFGIVNGELIIRSRGQVVDQKNPGMFDRAVAVLQRLAYRMSEGDIYRGEYLRTRKHNKLAYDRAPEKYIILFDIEDEHGIFFDIKPFADNLGLECVPTFWTGSFEYNEHALKEFLNQESILGGVPIEGIVIKNYNHKDRNGKVLMGKLVSESFRESHNNKKSRVQNSDVVKSIVEGYNKEARWNKAIQHLSEHNVLEHTPKDIGPLLKELASDFETECKEELKELLYAHFRKQLLKEMQDGFAQWYKNYLAFGE